MKWKLLRPPNTGHPLRCETVPCICFFLIAAATSCHKRCCVLKVHSRHSKQKTLWLNREHCGNKLQLLKRSYGKYGNCWWSSNFFKESARPTKLSWKLKRVVVVIALKAYLPDLVIYIASVNIFFFIVMKWNFGAMPCRSQANPARENKLLQPPASFIAGLIK